MLPLFVKVMKNAFPLNTVKNQISVNAERCARNAKRARIMYLQNNRFIVPFWIFYSVQQMCHGVVVRSRSKEWRRRRRECSLFRFWK